MAGETLDAYLTFTSGTAGSGSAPKIKGETHDATERSGGWDSMQIKSYNLKFELDTSGTEETPNKKGDTAAHHPQFQPVQITKTVDVSSPYLLAALCVAARYDKVWIAQRKAGAMKGAAGDYYWEIELRDVTIKNLTWSASTEGIPEETMELEYQGITAWYTPQKRSGELDLGKAVEYDYDLQSPDPGKNNKASMSESDTDAVVKKVLAMIAKANPTIKVPSR